MARSGKAARRAETGPIKGWDYFPEIARQHGLDYAKFVRIARADGPVKGLAVEYYGMDGVVIALERNDEWAFTKACQVIRDYVQSGQPYHAWVFGMRKV